MKLATFRNMFASLSLFVCTALSVAPLTIDVTGIQSVGQFGDANNTVQLYQVGANARITSLSYTGGLSAAEPSFLSEIGVALTDAAQTDGVFVAPGFAEPFPGAGIYTGFANLADLGLGFNVGSDGILRLEFFEFFDDFLGADGQWNFGTITIDYEAAQAVPEPASGLLLAGSLGLLGHTRRRSSNR